MRSVVVVLPASMCAMIPMFRMRRTSSSAVRATAADEMLPPAVSPCSAEAGDRRLAVEPLRDDAPAVAAAAAAALTAALLAVAPGDRNKGPARRRMTPARPRFSSSDMLYVLLAAER